MSERSMVIARLALGVSIVCQLVAGYLSGPTTGALLWLSGSFVAIMVTNRAMPDWDEADENFHERVQREIAAWKQSIKEAPRRESEDILRRGKEIWKGNR